MRARSSAGPASDGSSAGPGPRCSTGGSTSQSGAAREQRGRKAQPAGGRQRCGALPELLQPLAARVGPARSQEAGGIRMPAGDVAASPASTMRPAYMTAISSARPATTEIVGDPDQRGAMRRECLHFGEDLGLDGDVECGGWLVGDDEIGFVQQRDGDGNALAHAAGKLVRIGAQSFLRGRHADQAERVARARVRFRLWSRWRCAQHGLDHLRLDAQDRVQASSSDPGRPWRSGCRADGATRADSCARSGLEQDRPPSTAPAARRGRGSKSR